MRISSACKTNFRLVCRGAVGWLTFNTYVPLNFQVRLGTLSLRISLVYLNVCLLLPETIIKSFLLFVLDFAVKLWKKIAKNWEQEQKCALLVVPRFFVFPLNTYTYRIIQRWSRGSPVLSFLINFILLVCLPRFFSKAMKIIGIASAGRRRSTMYSSSSRRPFRRLVPLKMVRELGLDAILTNFLNL